MNKLIEEEINTVWTDFSDDVSMIIRMQGLSETEKYKKVKAAFDFAVGRVHELEVNEK